MDIVSVKSHAHFENKLQLQLLRGFMWLDCLQEYHATQEEQTGVVTQHQTAVTQHQTEDPQSTTDVQPKGSPQAKKSSVCTTLWYVD